MTANGRLASPESAISGATISPRAALVGKLTGVMEAELATAMVVLGKSFEERIVEVATIGVAVAEGESMKTVDVTTSQIELRAAAVGAGGSMKTVFVTTAHSLSAGPVATASTPPKVRAA